MSHRPYARSGIPSVTQVIGSFSVEDKAMAMSYSAAKITAETGDGREFRKRWDHKRNLGTRVHDMAVQWAAGESVESDETTDPYLDGLALFYERHQPTWLLQEQTVGYQMGNKRYVGSFDAIVKLTCPVCSINEPGGGWHFCTWLIDIKTTGKGPEVHLVDWTLQLSAYRWAQRLTTWEDGTERYAGSMPPVAHTGVLWLKPDGSAELVDVPTNGGSFNAFLRLLDVYNWAISLKKGSNVPDPSDRSPKQSARRSSGRTKDRGKDQSQPTLSI